MLWLWGFMGRNTTTRQWFLGMKGEQVGQLQGDQVEESPEGV